jgi:hypothetical protein
MAITFYTVKEKSPSIYVRIREEGKILIQKQKQNSQSIQGSK